MSDELSAFQLAHKQAAKELSVLNGVVEEKRGGDKFLNQMFAEKDNRIRELEAETERLRNAEREYQARLRTCMDMLSEHGVSAGEVWDRHKALEG